VDLKTAEEFVPIAIRDSVVFARGESPRRIFPLRKILGPVSRSTSVVSSSAMTAGFAPMPSVSPPPSAWRITWYAPGDRGSTV
jgi:hypothetical protein